MKKHFICILSLLSIVYNLYAQDNTLPSQWISRDIGSVSIPGLVEYSKNVFTLKGSGAGIKGNSDQCYFVYQACKGDIEIIAKIVSKTGTNTTAALMLRESMSASAKSFMTAIKADEISCNSRNTAGYMSTTYTAKEKLSTAWLKLIRKGTFLASYYSVNGLDWKEISIPQSITFNTSFIGLAVSSNDRASLAEVVFDQVTIQPPGEDVYLSDRGVYFYKKKYTPEPVPTYNASKNLLPVPVIDDNKGLIDMYNKAWQIAFSNIKAPKTGSPFVSNWFDEAFDENIFQWDMIFMTMFSKYAHHIFPGIQSLDNFYCRQKASGSICRAINEVTGADWFDETSSNLINPPLFSWVEVEYYQATGDKSRFEHVLPVLEKYFEFVDKARVGADTPHKLYWSNGQASGMDNTPRDTGRNNGHYSTDHQGWVDMSSQMVIQANNIALICEELGYTEKAEKYRTKAIEIGNHINEWLWSEKDGIYYDVTPQGKHTHWKTIACFWPMLAGITSPEQDAKLIEHLKNPDEFWRDMVFASLSATHSEYRSNGGYWQGASWAPTTYATIKGLETIGDNEFAKEASEKYVAGLYEVFLQTGTLWENYAPDRLNGVLNPGVHDYTDDSFCRKDFVGWTGLGPITLLIENILGFRMNGADKVLTYYLQRDDRHGIQNLRMADITTSLITEDRKQNMNEAKVTVESDKPYRLIIHFNGTIREYNVKTGINHFILESGLGINKPLISDELQLLSNPVKNELSFELHLKKSQKVEVSVNDLQGNLLINFSEWMSQGVKQKSLNVEQLTDALYLLTITTPDKSYTVKWIKG